MPEKIKINESVPLLTTGKTHHDEETPEDPVVGEDGSLNFTMDQLREILVELKLTQFDKRKTAMLDIYPVLYLFRYTRIREIESREQAEPLRARQAYRAVQRARSTLDSLGRAARESVLQDEDPDFLDALISGLAVLSGSLEIFVNQYPSQPTGPTVSSALEDAVRSLRKIFKDAHRGRAKSAGSFARFCETTLRIVEPSQHPLPQTAIANVVKKISRRATN